LMASLFETKRNEVAKRFSFLKLTDLQWNAHYQLQGFAAVFMRPACQEMFESNGAWKLFAKSRLCKLLLGKEWDLKCHVLFGNRFTTQKIRSFQDIYRVKQVDLADMSRWPTMGALLENGYQVSLSLRITEDDDSRDGSAEARREFPSTSDSGRLLAEMDQWDANYFRKMRERVNGLFQ
jgi:hypothetical protein